MSRHVPQSQCSDRAMAAARRYRCRIATTSPVTPMGSFVWLAHDRAAVRGAESIELDTAVRALDRTALRLACGTTTSSTLSDRICSGHAKLSNGCRCAGRHGGLRSCSAALAVSVHSACSSTIVTTASPGPSPSLAPRSVAAHRSRRQRTTPARSPAVPQTRRRSQDDGPWNRPSPRRTLPCWEVAGEHRLGRSR